MSLMCHGSGSIHWRRGWIFERSGGCWLIGSLIVNGGIRVAHRGWRGINTIYAIRNDSLLGKSMRACLHESIRKGRRW
jgi:hypothetical protein